MCATGGSWKRRRTRRTDDGECKCFQKVTKNRCHSVARYARVTSSVTTLDPRAGPRTHPSSRPDGIIHGHGLFKLKDVRSRFGLRVHPPACLAVRSRAGQEKRACQCGHKCMCDYGRVNKALLSLFLAMREVTLR